MAISTHTKKRTQEERSSATRAHILETTFHCLNELGFARTTTVEVCKRGEISRGALLHHYPTKEHLVVAAVEDVFERRFSEFNTLFSELPDSTDRRGLVIDLLWQIFSGSTFYVWLELLVGARTDPQLNTVVSAMANRFSERFAEAERVLFPKDDKSSAELGYKFSFAFLTGLAVDRIIPDAVPVESMLSALKCVGEKMNT